MSTTSQNEDAAPGWDAIDEAFKRVYGHQEPKHWGTVLPFTLGGKDPLDGLSVYTSEKIVPHWHYVSYGMTELYGKESEDPDESGWGFEFTFRLARGAETEPPMWPINFLQNLARYVFATSKPFDVHHTIPANGPIAVGEDTEMRAMTFCLDPELGQIDTPHGRVRFLQIVGLSEAELEAAKGGKAGEILNRLAQDNALLVTDLKRRSTVAAPKLGLFRRFQKGG